eukprot:Clim_evm2s219 gene=Clim_evmTU2s219
MANIDVCTITDDAKAACKKLRFRKAQNNGILSLKIESIEKDARVVIDEVVDNADIEDFGGDLPIAEPRYVVISYCFEHDDGRKSFPLVFVSYFPDGTKPQLNMIYTGAQPAVMREFQINKSLNLRDPEELTEEWINECLGLV